MRRLSLVPRFTGTLRCPLADTLVFILFALAGEWLVHQLEYRIEYGQYFDQMMSHTPHRFYMTTLGIIFGLLFIVSFGMVSIVMRSDIIRRRRLMDLLPVWMHRLVPVTRIHLSPVSLAATALALASMQTIVYLVQENWETYTLVGVLPGMSVLIAPQHATVIPIHVLVACVSSLLLWTLTSWRRVFHISAAVGESLLRLALRWLLTERRTAPVRSFVPRRSLSAVRRSLRSPPTVA